MSSIRSVPNGSYPFNKSYMLDSKVMSTRIPSRVRTGEARKASTTTLPSLRGSFRALPMPTTSNTRRHAPLKSRDPAALLHEKMLEADGSMTPPLLKTQSHLYRDDTVIEAIKPVPQPLSESRVVNEFAATQDTVSSMTKELQSSRLSTIEETDGEMATSFQDLLRLPGTNMSERSMNRLSNCSLSGLRREDWLKAETLAIQTEDACAACDQDFLHWLGTYDARALVPSSRESCPSDLEGKTVHEQLCIYGAFYAGLWDRLPNGFEQAAPVLRALVIILDRRLNVLEGNPTTPVIKKGKLFIICRKACRWIKHVVSRQDSPRPKSSDALQAYHSMLTAGDRQLWYYPEPGVTIKSAC